MRLARVLCPGLLLIAVTGCLHGSDGPRWTKNIPWLQSTPAEDAALIDHVLVERPAGGDEINRRVWDRVDEQFLPFETRAILEEAGLRVGIASESAPGSLRKLIDNPRTIRGHRRRTFALEKPAALYLSEPLARAEFALPAADGSRAAFARDQVTLGFDLTVRDAPHGKVHVRFVPRARYKDPSRLLPADPENRDQASDTFPGAAFEVTLLPAEYLVIGTDSYWKGTFGHSALVDPNYEEPVQRLFVLRARRSKPDRDHLLLAGGDDRPSAPPIATQASLARGFRP